MKNIVLRSLSFGILLQMFCFTGLTAQGNSKALEIQSIYVQILEATGFDRGIMPVLSITAESSCSRPVACFRKGIESAPDTIFLEPQAVEVCLSQGENWEAAIAFLLGHELAHYFQERIWPKSLPKVVELDCEAKLDDSELEADLYSLFIMRQIDFEPDEIMEDLLTKLWTKYSRKLTSEEDLDYLLCRASLTDSICSLVDHLWRTNQLANWLMAMQDTDAYQAALSLYQYLSQYVVHPEIENNIGLANLFIALSTPERDSNWYQFKYPILMDWDTPNRKDPGMRYHYLSQAEKHLYKAFQLAPQDIDISINVACLLDVQHKYYESTLLINKLVWRDDITQQQKSQLNLLKGILAAHQGQSEKANAHFRTGLEDNFPSWQEISRKNLNILEGKKPPIDRVFILEDHLDNVPNISRYKLRTDKVFHFEPDYTTSLQEDRLKNSDFFRISTDRAQIDLQFTNSKHLSTTRGVKVGDSLANVRKAYPDLVVEQSINHSLGYFLVYPSRGLIFNMSSTNMATGWGVYQVNKF